MDPDTLAPRGAFGTALATVSAAGGSGALERSVSRNPAEVLAALMDFPGSVALAELLSAPLPAQAKRAASDASSAAEKLFEQASARMDALEPMALKPLLGRRAPALLEPHELMSALQRYGLGAERSEAGILKLADELGEPFFSALGASLRQAQAHVHTLRWEIAHEIRALGPKADRLERIDAGLTRAMQAKMGELLDRMEYAARLTFERACVHAVQELPEHFTEQDLAAWAAEDGWLGRYRERCVRMTKALFGHLRRGLEGLLRAATHEEDT
jgi:hypothetical protein